jgi:hypothetical protein
MALQNRTGYVLRPVVDARPRSDAHKTALSEHRQNGLTPDVAQVDRSD